MPESAAIGGRSEKANPRQLRALAVTENPWKNVRPTSTAGGIRKTQARAIRSREAEWDANYKRLQEENKAEAERTIATFNEQIKRPDKIIMSSPLLIAALLSRQHWMHVHCPGCNTIAAVDLTMIRRPPTTALTTIAEKLKCERCRGQAAPPQIVKITRTHEWSDDE